MEEGKLFYNKNDVCEILGVADSKAYKIIKQLNDELASNGYITVRGRVPAEYFEKRLAIKKRKAVSERTVNIRKEAIWVNSKTFARISVSKAKRNLQSERQQSSRRKWISWQIELIRFVEIATTLRYLQTRYLISEIIACTWKDLNHTITNLIEED